MDIVPCIPAADIQRASLRIAILKHNPNMEISVDPITGNAVYITDDRLPNFNHIYGNWLVSNMEGYALWFEMRMHLDKALISKTAAKFETRIDDVPQFIRKRPLQKAIQLLKRHRDVFFRNKDELKPISVILTTLAAQAYQGETFVTYAIEGILSRIENGIRQHGKKVPNPVNPEEDFADKWTMPKYAHLKLEENFRNWVIQAKSDFKNLTDWHNAETINKVTKSRFDVTLNLTDISKLLGIPLIEVVTNPIHIANPQVKPWCM